MPDRKLAYLIQDQKPVVLALQELVRRSQAQLDHRT